MGIEWYFPDDFFPYTLCVRNTLTEHSHSHFRPNIHFSLCVRFICSFSSNIFFWKKYLSPNILKNFAFGFISLKSCRDSRKSFDLISHSFHILYRTLRTIWKSPQFSELTSGSNSYSWPLLISFDGPVCAYPQTSFAIETRISTWFAAKNICSETFTWKKWIVLLKDSQHLEHLAQWGWVNMYVHQSN